MSMIVPIAPPNISNAPDNISNAPLPIATNALMTWSANWLAVSIIVIVSISNDLLNLLFTLIILFSK